MSFGPPRDRSLPRSGSAASLVRPNLINQSNTIKPAALANKENEPQQQTVSKKPSTGLAVKLPHPRVSLSVSSHSSRPLRDLTTANQRSSLGKPDSVRSECIQSAEPLKARSLSTDLLSSASSLPLPSFSLLDFHCHSHFLYQLLYYHDRLSDLMAAQNRALLSQFVDSVQSILCQAEAKRQAAVEQAIEKQRQEIREFLTRERSEMDLLLPRISQFQQFEHRVKERIEDENRKFYLAKREKLEFQAIQTQWKQINQSISEEGAAVERQINRFEAGENATLDDLASRADQLAAIWEAKQQQQTKLEAMWQTANNLEEENIGQVMSERHRRWIEEYLVFDHS